MEEQEEFLKTEIESGRATASILLMKKRLPAMRNGAKPGPSRADCRNSGVARFRADASLETDTFSADHREQPLLLGGHRHQPDLCCLHSVADCFRLDFNLVVPDQVSGLDERIGGQDG